MTPPTLRISTVCAIGLAALLAVAAPARPQPQSQPTPADDPRVVAYFDFDERDDGNYEQLPRHWLPVVDAGFPSHTADRTGFHTAHAVSGKHSVRLQSDGGSAALTLRRGVVAAVPGAAYRLDAKLRTADMDRSRARLTAYLVDDQGERVDGATATSDLAVSNGRWRDLSVDLLGDHDNAAWLVVRIELLQPRQFQPDRLGEHTLHKQDIGAAAWFDDLTIRQVPRLELATAEATGIIRAPDRVAVDAVVKDFAGDALTATLSIYNHRGELVDRHQRRLAGRQPPRWQWEPDLQRFGWYLVALEVRNASGPVGSRRLGLCWLPARSATGASPRLGINADTLPTALRSVLPDALDAVGAGSVIVPLWRADDTKRQVERRIDDHDGMLGRLIDDRRRITLAFAGVPAALAEAANVDADRPLSLFSGDGATWRDPVQRYAAELAYSIDHWQIGRSTSFEPIRASSAAAGYDAVRQVLRRLTGHEAAVLPWPAEAPLTQAARDADRLMIRIPNAVHPGHLAAYADGWAERADRAALSLATLAPGRFAAEARAVDLTHRLLEAWATPAPTIFLDLPWHAGQGVDPGQSSPGPLAAALANLHDRLAGRSVVGRFDLAPDVPAYILNGPRGGALVAWSQSPDRPKTELTMHLGGKPDAFDVWGNPVELDPTPNGHRFTVERRPLFIEPIDAKLARFRAGLRLEPALLESANRVHEVTLTIANPWDRSLTGVLRFDPPPRWSIQPRQLSIAVEPGQTIERKLAVRFPLSETAGRKLIPVHAKLDSNRPHAINLKLPIRIGLRAIEFEPHLAIERREDRRDVVATLIVTNHGDRPRSFYAFAMAPDQPTAQRIISRLAPGASVIKRLRLPDAAGPLSGRTIRVGLRELDGPAMLSRLLNVP